MNKYFTIILKCLFSLSMLVFFPLTINAKENTILTINDYTGLDVEKHAQASEIILQLKEQLNELGVSVGHKHSHPFSNLDDETKEKAKEILNNLKEGTITKEEAKTQLAELGVKHEKKHHHFEGLDNETKEKAKEIFTQLREGKLSHEEAKNQLAELGVKLPEKKHHKLFEGLDEETKTKAKEIFKQVREGKITHEEAKTKLEELGVKFDKHDHLESLDAETKEKVGILIEDAKMKLEGLGMDLPKRFEKLLKEVNQ